MRTQRGMSATGVLILLIIGGFFVMCLVKVGPLYYSNYKLDTIFKRIGTEGIPIESQTTSDIRRRLSSQFSVDGVRNVSPEKVKIERKNGEVTLIYIHEDRVNLFGNLDVVVNFENRFSTAEN